jgi:hypothetical protein
MLLVQGRVVVVLLEVQGSAAVVLLLMQGKASVVLLEVQGSAAVVLLLVQGNACQVWKGLLGVGIDPGKLVGGPPQPGLVGNHDDVPDL